MGWLLSRIKKHYLEIIIFSFISAILFVDLNPDYTFVNKAADSIGYLYSAKYLYPSYHTSPPFYLLLGHLFLYLPFGTEAWRMGLISVLSTIIACVFIYLIIKDKTNKWYGLLGALLYGTSAIVISQSIIVNTYALVCMLAVVSYYFATKKKWKLMALFLGIGLATHLLSAFVFIILVLAYKEYRKNWRCWLITLSFGIFYIYIPLTNRPPYMWLPDPNTVNTIWATICDTASVILMLIGKLSIWDLPKRIFDTIGIIGVSISVINIIPIVIYFWKTKFWRNVLFYLIIVPICIFVGELDMNTYDYTMLAMPFLSIVACFGLYKMVLHCGVKAKHFAYATAIVVIGFAVFNFNYFDIGRNLDKDLSASNLYYNEFDKIPDSQYVYNEFAGVELKDSILYQGYWEYTIFMPNFAWEWEAIYKYNADYDKNIYPICIDVLPSEIYRQQLRNDGIKLIEYDIENQSVLAMKTAQSIIELNDNVWTTVSTEPSTFGSKVVEANGDITLVEKWDIEYAEWLEEHPQVRWKPYNPYDIITTSITVEKWRYVLMSNWNVGFFLGLGSIGMILNWIIFVLPARRKAKNEKDIQDDNG